MPRRPGESQAAYFDRISQAIRSEMEDAIEQSALSPEPGPEPPPMTQPPGVTGWTMSPLTTTRTDGWPTLTPYFTTAATTGSPDIIERRVVYAPINDVSATADTPPTAVEPVAQADESEVERIERRLEEANERLSQAFSGLAGLTFGSEGRRSAESRIHELSRAVNELQGELEVAQREEARRAEWGHLEAEDMTENARPDDDPRPDDCRWLESYLADRHQISLPVPGRLLGDRGAFASAGAMHGWSKTFNIERNGNVRRELMAAFAGKEVGVVAVAYIHNYRRIGISLNPIEVDERIVGPMAEEYERLSEEAGVLYHRLRSAHELREPERQGIVSKSQLLSAKMEEVASNIGRQLAAFREWFASEASRRFRTRDGARRSVAVWRVGLGELPGRSEMDGELNATARNAARICELPRDPGEMGWSESGITAQREAKEMIAAIGLTLPDGLTAGSLPSGWSASHSDESSCPDQPSKALCRCVVDLWEGGDLPPTKRLYVSRLFRAIRIIHWSARMDKMWSEFRAAIEREGRRRNFIPATVGAHRARVSEICQCCGRVETVMRRFNPGTGGTAPIEGADLAAGMSVIATRNNPNASFRPNLDGQGWRAGYLCRPCLGPGFQHANCSVCGVPVESAVIRSAIGTRERRCPNCAAHQEGWRWDDRQGEYVCGQLEGRAGYHNDNTRRNWRRPSEGTKQAVGIELECEIPASKQGPASAAIREAGWAFERDGSLDGERGVEIVSPPLSYDAGPHHLDLSNFKGQLDRILKAIPRGSQGYDCGKGYGLHVNLNAGNWTDKQIGAYCSLFCLDQGQKKLFEALAGREENQWARYHPSKGCQSDKYFAAALKGGVGSARVEVRIFRSTLRPESLLGAVAFCCDVERFVLATGAKVDDAGALVAWLERNASPETAGLFAARRATRLITPLAEAYRAKPEPTKVHFRTRDLEVDEDEGRGDPEPDPEPVTIATACLPSRPGPDDAIIDPEPWTPGPPLDVNARDEASDEDEGVRLGDAVLRQLGEENEDTYEEDDLEEEFEDECDRDPDGEDIW